MFRIGDTGSSKYWCEVRRTNDLPQAPLHGFDPKLDSGLFSGVDFLAFSKKGQKREPLGHSVRNSAEELRFRVSQ